MAIYYVELNTKVVDGSKYNSNDIIVIRAGKRAGLKFQNFNGNGSYITITNERTTPSTKVEINGMSGFGCLSISNCKYIDLRGDNDDNLTYGIKVINDDISPTSGSVWVYGKSEYIKLGYLEITCEGSTGISGTGIQIQDGNLTNAWTFNNFEIHNNYIHNTRYAGMYLGFGNPLDSNNPYISNFSVHDNLLEDLGSYGMTVKGVHSTSGVVSIYDNVIRRTGIVRDDLADSFKFGIGGSNYYGITYANIYGNWVEKTVGAGIQMGDQKHQIHNNIILGCGSGDAANWGHGIVVHSWRGAMYDTEIYDNIIMQAHGYGIKELGACTNISYERNLIGDCGLGEADGDGLVEGTGPDANIYHADVADFGFKRWSDDGDYSNDDFTIGDPCEGVVCDNICIGKDLWSQKCVEGGCIPDQLLESNSASCGYVPCDGVVCENICIGKDLWSQICVEGDCIPDQLLESNSVTCELCEGVVCGNTCVGDDLWSQSCDPDTGNCVPNQLIQLDSINCKIPDQVPSDESTINTYIILGGFGLMGLAMLILRKQ